MSNPATEEARVSIYSFAQAKHVEDCIKGRSKGCEVHESLEAAGLRFHMGDRCRVCHGAPLSAIC